MVQLLLSHGGARASVKNKVSKLLGTTTPTLEAHPHSRAASQLLI